MSKLADKSCVPCKGGTPPLGKTAAAALLKELGGGWKIVNDQRIEKEYRFKNFKEALAFANRAGAIAEKEGHHPDILIAWGRAQVTLWTHAVNGLSESDFVLAAKIDKGEPSTRA